MNKFQREDRYGEWEFRQWEQMLGSVTRSENIKWMLRDWDADRSKLETDIESLTAKLEAATTALENIATHSDGIPGDEGDDAFYDYCEVKDLAAAALKSIKEDA